MTTLDVTRDGKVALLDPMRPAWVHIAQSLTYTEAEQALDDGDPKLSTLNACAQALRERRRTEGAVMLETDTDTCAMLDAQGHAVLATPHKRQRSEQLVEETMIASNIACAQWLHEHRGCALYRTHAPPTQESIDLARAIAAETKVEGARAPVEEWAQTVVGSGVSERRWPEQIMRIAMGKASYQRTR